MKSIKNRFFSLAIIFSIVFSVALSSSRTYSGFFFGRKPIKTTSVWSIFNNKESMFTRVFAGAGIALSVVASVCLAWKYWFSSNKTVTPSPDKLENNPTVTQNPKPKVTQKPKTTPENKENKHDPNIYVENKDTNDKQKVSLKVDPKDQGTKKVELMLPKKEIFDLSAYRKGYQRVGNVDYIQINTVNQFDANVNQHVKAKYDGAKLERDKIKKVYDGIKNKKDPERGKLAVRMNGYKRIMNNFAAGATCPSQSIRNVRLICEFLSERDVERKRDILGLINSEQDASDYLKNMVDNNTPTSWLESRDIENIIGSTNITGSMPLSDRVAVVDSVLSVGSGMYNHITNAFVSNDNYYHVFIVNTGDISSEYDLRHVLENFSSGCTCDIDQKKFGSLVRSRAGGNHWYVAAIVKEGDSIRYITLDTIGTNNHITRIGLRDRDRFLCECILAGYSSIDIRGGANSKIIAYALDNNLFTLRQAPSFAKASADRQDDRVLRQAQDDREEKKLDKKSELKKNKPKNKTKKSELSKLKIGPEALKKWQETAEKRKKLK